jgi:hypothetical protein|tara:strand:- start:80 stop:346 length:267 start_codon:yes stop_codon:yes gene_type:complete
MSASNQFDRVINHTCDSGDNNNNFKIGAVLVINGLVKSGREYITLCELYAMLGAESDAQKTGVRWGVRVSKESGIIISTERRGVYEVR